MGLNASLAGMISKSSIRCIISFHVMSQAYRGRNKAVLQWAAGMELVVMLSSSFMNLSQGLILLAPE